ncbi:MAG TPA: hypothetical protein VGO16_06280 [Pseudonocardiaceae bacterium]|jgi:hypothetical protein|nr:hypothetical protein [Pseudonocardiaceae bacterium]
MAGPHPPNPAVGAEGAQQAQPYPQTGPNEPETLEFPHHLSGTEPAFTPTGPPASGSYRKRRPKRLLIGTLLAIALVTALTTAIVYGVRTNGANTGSAFNEGSAKTAIQSYLNSLSHRDIDGIVRNSLCGLYDSVKDKRSDQALAKLSSDAFRKQFSDVAVTTIDKVVYLSQYQAQVLFSMQVTPAAGGPARGQMQGIAQVLFQRGDILVCSYVLRTTGQF